MQSFRKINTVASKTGTNGESLIYLCHVCKILPNIKGRERTNCNKLVEMLHCFCNTSIKWNVCFECNFICWKLCLMYQKICILYLASHAELPTLPHWPKALALYLENSGFRNSLFPSWFERISVLLSVSPKALWLKICEDVICVLILQRWFLHLKFDNAFPVCPKRISMEGYYVIQGKTNCYNSPPQPYAWLSSAGKGPCHPNVWFVLASQL